MKKCVNLLNKYWFPFVCLWLVYVLYSTFTDPIAAAAAKERLVNPVYYITFGSLSIGWIVFAIWWRRKSKKEWRLIREYSKALTKNITKSVEETKLLRENEIPDAKSISKYYKMYLKKFELDNVDTWNTEEPIPFDIWLEAARADVPPEGEFPRVRWAFMISMTSDMFMFDPETGASTMMRYLDYESMIEEHCSYCGKKERCNC